MYKELVICIIILIIIFSLDYITQKYTDKTINEAIQELRNLQEEIKQENVDYEKVAKEVNDLYEKWWIRHRTFAYYIEHTELEKVETNFVAGKSYIESSEYNEAISELEKTVFILDHINDKYSFNLENIF